MKQPKPPKAPQLDPEVTRNLMKALHVGDPDRMSSSLQGLPSKIVEEAVSMLKKQANEAFARGRYKDAVDLYTQAIAGAPGEKTLYSNRSLALYRLHDYQAALEDAQEVLKLDVEWVKGHYRKGAALMALGRAQEALPYLRKVAGMLPEDQECQELLAKATKEVEDVAAAAAAPQTQPSSGLNEGDAVTLPRKVFYPTQDWFTQHQVGQALQRQLQLFSDLDGPRRLITTLSDPADLVGFWTSYLSTKAPGLGARCLMVGSLGGVAPFHVKKPEQPPQGGNGTDKVVVVERYPWVGNLVRGIISKNNILARRRERQQQQQPPEEGSEAGGAVKASATTSSAPLSPEDERIVLSKKRPQELLEQEQEEEAFDSVVWLDWDFTLLGSGAAKFLRSARQSGLVRAGAAGLGPLGVRVMAMGIQVLPQGPEGAERMLWELGPCKFDLPDKAYRVLTEVVEVWNESDLSQVKPKQQPVSFPAVCQGRLDAIVYWYHLMLPTNDTMSDHEVVVLDSSRFPSIGRGVTWMDPMPVDPEANPPLTVTAYRSESQLGFWPLTTVKVTGVERAYRLPRWYPDMLVDEARNQAYERAIQRVCKGRRVLDVGSGTGLLSAMAVEAGAGKVLGCEEVSELAELSKKILGPDVKIFVKDVRQLKLAMPAEVVLHEVFDSGMLGEGVLHLLQPQQQSSTPPPRMLPARTKVWAQLMDMRFEEVAGVNVTLLNPYRYQKDYTSSDCHGAVAMSDPFVIDTVDFAVDGPELKGLRLPGGPVRACRTGIISAVRLWFVVEFGDEKDGEGGGTVLDSRDGHWQYAVHYIPEARFQEGDVVPLVVSRTANAEYSLRMPEDLVYERMVGTPRSDQAWIAAQEKAEKTTSDIFQRIASTGKNESKVIFRVAYRMASHPAEFGVEPVMASRFFHAVMAAVKHGRQQKELQKKQQQQQQA